jgi:hypothetical protein
MRDAGPRIRARPSLHGAAGLSPRRHVRRALSAPSTRRPAGGGCRTRPCATSRTVRASWQPRLSARCNSDAECTNATSGFVGTCVTQDVMGVHEQVCVLLCTDSCPSGLVCSGGRCLPPVGVPCANWLAAVSRTSCLSDGACAPLGAVSAVYPGACEGEDTTIDPKCRASACSPAATARTATTLPADRPARAPGSSLSAVRERWAISLLS